MRRRKLSLLRLWALATLDKAMATPPASSRHASALLWILIVLVLGGIALTLLFPAVGCGPEPAVRTQAKNDVVQIATAINAYVTEYGHLPLSPKADRTLSNDPTQRLLFDVLVGQSINNENIRRIVFLEIPRAKSGHNGRMDDKGPYLDSWGQPYFIRLDGNYDGSVASPDSDPARPVITKSVIVWSQGNPEKKKSYDDPKRWIKSWE